MLGSRVYVLLDVVEGKSDQVARALQRRAGVRIVDVLEDSPNVIMVIEAGDRHELARLTVQALALVEAMTDDVRLLPAKDDR